MRVLSEWTWLPLIDGGWDLDGCLSHKSVH